MQKEEVKALLCRIIDQYHTDNGADTTAMIKTLRDALESGDLDQMTAACKTGLDYCERKKNDSFKTVVEAVGGWIRSLMGAPVGLSLKCITMHRGVTHYVGGPGAFMYVACTPTGAAKKEGGTFDVSCVINAEGAVSVDKGFRRYGGNNNATGLTMMCVWTDDSETIDVYEM